MSNSKRTNSPAPAPAVPWAVPNQGGMVPDESHIEAMTDVNPVNTIHPPVNGEIPTPPVDFDNSKAAPIDEKLKSLFAPPPTHGKSVFAPAPKAEVKEPEPEFSMEGAPSWGELVAFVQKHGKDIVQVRYPRPLGDAIDTIYRGVTVIKHDGTQVRHVKHGWIDWKDAIY